MDPTSNAGTRHRAITRILIANRGEIARRVIRTAREMGIGTVAVFSDADADAPHVAEADHAVRLPGSTPADTYLRGDLIVSAARATGADAIHPGYGFLSENAAFARACSTAGIVFIGPSPEAIDAMGSKIEAKRRMAGAGVPVLPGFTVQPDTPATDLLAAAEDITYPVLVKASFGGGGRGMRIVRDPDTLADAVAGAQREAAAAFGDGTVFLERYVEGPRHIEVQIFGDRHDSVIALFERECSIQRRHQKVIEEAPSPVVTDEQRASLCAAAISAGRSLAYVGAGTVEFVMDRDGSFFFLEVNTRVQVEHPVTEMITGLDLVRLQIEVAGGAPLPAEATAAGISGHSIEARLYAEDVVAGFIPVSGPLYRLSIPAGPGVRVDSGYVDGSTVSTFYDAMIAKVIAWAPTRREATARLADALRRSEIHGIVTNRDLLVATLQHPDFDAGRTDTAFFDRNDHVVLGAPPPLAVHRVHAAAASLAPSTGPASPHPSGVPIGWRSVGVSRSTTSFTSGTDTIVVGTERSRDGLAIAVDDDSPAPVVVISSSATEVEMEMLGRRHRVRLHRVVGPDGVEVVHADSSLGSSALTVVPRFALPERHVAAGSLVSPMPGTVIAVHAVVGDRVSAGQVVVVLEAMKMEHAIRSPIDGTVGEVRVTVGAQVTTGAVLVVVTEQESE